MASRRTIVGRHAAEIHLARGRSLDAVRRSTGPATRAGAGRAKLPGATEAGRVTLEEAGGAAADASSTRRAREYPKDYPEKLRMQRGERDRLHGGSVQRSALHHVGCGGAASADCLLQRGQHAAGPRHHARARDDAPHGARRRPRPHRPPADDRERAAGRWAGRRSGASLPTLASTRLSRGCRRIRCPAKWTSRSIRSGAACSVSWPPASRPWCSAWRPRCIRRRRDLVERRLAGAAGKVAGGRGRLRNALVAAEIALALVLVMSAGVADAQLHLGDARRSRVQPGHG